MDEEREVASIRVGDRIRHALGFQLLLREGVNTGAYMAGAGSAEAITKPDAMSERKSRPDGDGTDVGIRLRDQRVKPTNKAGRVNPTRYGEGRRQFGGDDKRLWRAEVHASDGRCGPRNQEPSIIDACHQCIGMGERVKGGRGRKKPLVEVPLRVSVPEVRKAKVKAAKATGYSPRTLEKVQVVREASEKDPLRRV